MSEPNEDTIFLLVEGKFDVPWFKRAVSLLGFSNRVVVLPGGGCDNLPALQDAFSEAKFKSLTVVDGDAKNNAKKLHRYALKLECIELYTPDAVLRNLFGVRPTRLSKDRFFATLVHTRYANSNNDIKRMIAAEAPSFLTIDSPFVQEIGAILNYHNHHRSC